MSLKHKIPPTPPEPVTAKPDKWSGSWGRINPAGGGIDVVRFSQRSDGSPERTHSYPYRVLSSWHWSEGLPEEELKIEAGADLVIVIGRGLVRVVDALDAGTLEVLSEAPDGMPSVENSVLWIKSILIESSKVD